jgi:hypothetical protein
LAARDGDLRVGLGTSLVRVVGSLDTEPFSLLAVCEEAGGEEGGGEAGGGEAGGEAGETEVGPPRWTAISSVQTRRRLRRYSSVSRSTTSSLVSCSTALILCTTCGEREIIIAHHYNTVHSHNMTFEMCIFETCECYCSFFKIVYITLLFII